MPQLNVVSGPPTIYKSHVHKQSQNSQAVASVIKGMSYPRVHVKFIFEVWMVGMMDLHKYTSKFFFMNLLMK